MSLPVANMSTLQVYEALMNQTDDFFRFIMAVLIVLSLFGFGLFEAGVARNAKIMMPIMLKTLLVVLGSMISFWLFGYALAFGGTNVYGGGQVYWAWSSMNSAYYAHFWLQYAYAALSASIALGALGERCHIATYIIFPFLWCGFAYPIVAHWVWHPNGWLYVGTTAWNAAFNGTTAQAPFFDASGSAVVNMTGGIAALFGAILLRPRIYRFNNSKVINYDHHSTALTMIGGAMMLIGLLVFNGTGIEFVNYLNNYVQLANGGNMVFANNYLPFSYVAVSLTNSIIAAAVGAFVIYFLQLIIKLPPNFVQVLSGALSALASISSCSMAVQPWAASIFGFFAAFGYILWSWILKKFKVDDVIDAFAIFASGGMWGLIATAFLAYFNSYAGIVWSANTLSGYLLAWQIVGICAVWAWAGACSMIIFGILRLLKLLRVGEEQEREGLEPFIASVVEAQMATPSPHSKPTIPIYVDPISPYDLQRAPSQAGSVYNVDKSTASLPRFTQAGYLA